MWPVQGILGHLKEKDRLPFISANRLFQAVRSKIKTTPTYYVFARTIMSGWWTNHSNSFGKILYSNLSLVVKYQQAIWDAVFKKDHVHNLLLEKFSILAFKLLGSYIIYMIHVWNTQEYLNIIEREYVF